LESFAFYRSAAQLNSSLGRFGFSPARTAAFPDR
jgi:hypothetical protein